MSFLNINPGESLTLPARGSRQASIHVFDEASIDAVDAALAAGRPLLLRGEPGAGKSQLARAAAEALGRVFHSVVIDAQTEPRDLLWRFDTVARLAEAQLIGALGVVDPEELRQQLEEQRFLSPGPLWWALHWADAKKQAILAKTEIPEPPKGWKPETGMVLLIDEIDKADVSVPNGLLEALGQSRFSCPGGQVVGLSTGQPAPLVIITTNEERALPDAFLRRCLVHHLTLPEKEEALVEFLITRGQAHFPDCQILETAAHQVWRDRRDVLERRLSPPGTAEYLDLVRAITTMEPDPEDQKKLLERIGKFALKKHTEEPRW